MSVVLSFYFIWSYPASSVVVPRTECLCSTPNFIGARTTATIVQMFALTHVLTAYMCFTSLGTAEIEDVDEDSTPPTAPIPNVSLHAAEAGTATGTNRSV